MEGRSSPHREGGTLGADADAGADLAALYEAAGARGAGELAWALEGSRLDGEPAASALAGSARARDAYLEISRRARQAEPIARAIMAELAERSRADAEEVVGRIRADPAAPGAENVSRFLLSELSNLAAIFVTVGPQGRTPDPADEYAPVYRGVVGALQALRAEMESQQPLWDFLRGSRALARGRPPPRAAPRRPLADDKEYYF